MAFLGELTKKTKSRKSQGLRMERDEREPSSVSDVPWLFESDPKYSSIPSEGKWMLFYDHSSILPMWRKCQTLYRAGQLTDVESLKVSTLHDRHKHGSGVIILYCGPPSDELRCMRIGKMIVEQTGYFPTGQRIHYKRDIDTMKGRYRMTYTIQINDDGTPNVDLDALEKELQSRMSRSDQFDHDEGVVKSSAETTPKKKKWKKKKKKKTLSKTEEAPKTSEEASVILAGGAVTSGVMAPVIPGASAAPIPVAAVPAPIPDTAAAVPIPEVSDS